MPVQPWHGAFLYVTSDTTADDKVGAVVPNLGEQLDGVDWRVSAVGVGVDHISSPGGKYSGMNRRAIASRYRRDNTGSGLSGDLGRVIDRTVVYDQNFPVGVRVLLKDSLALGQELTQRAGLVQAWDDESGRSVFATLQADLLSHKHHLDLAVKNRVQCV